MVERERESYMNRLGHTCRYPKTNSEVYNTGENHADKKIAQQILTFTGELKGIHYLQSLKLPGYLIALEDQKAYVRQRFFSAPALAAYMVRVNLRSSRCALYEYLHGTLAANEKFFLRSTKNLSGNIIDKIEKCSAKLPRKYIVDSLLSEEQEWLYNKIRYGEACRHKVSIYQQISELAASLSDKREQTKVNQLINQTKDHKKILAFDSTVITLDYLHKLLSDRRPDLKVIVAAGHNTSNREQVTKLFALGN